MIALNLVVKMNHGRKLVGVYCNIPGVSNNNYASMEYHKQIPGKNLFSQQCNKDI